MNKLSKEEVLHVAALAKIKLTDDEVEKYRVELKTLMDDIDKIKDVKGYDDDILIAPWSNNTILRSDTEGNMLKKEDFLKNVPKHSGNYIVVPRVMKDRS